MPFPDESGSARTKPESFFVAEREGPLEKGERERAEQWAEQIFAMFEASRGAQQDQVGTR